MRKDLSPAQIAVQSAHAVLQSNLDSQERFEQHPNIIILGATDENELLTIDKYLANHSIFHSLFREPDIGQNQATAIATFAVSGKQRRLFRKFKLI